LRNGRDYYLDQGLFPEELLCQSIAGLRQISKKLGEFYTLYQAQKPNIETAVNTALWLELSAGELHYQHVMTNQSASNIVEVFQKLNGDDKDHAERIKIFMQKKGIDEKDIS